MVRDAEGPDRTALVTGAARGIGRAAVLAFAGAGWRVIAAVRDPGRLDPFPLPGVHVVRLDVTDAGSVADAMGQAHRIAGGALDCVVCNAGWALFGAVEDVDLDEARRQFETNLFGAVAVMQHSLPPMRAAGRGSVVAVSTLSGRIPLPLFGMYSASKLALAAVCEALSLEAAPFGIRVTIVEAGVVATEFARATVISGCVAEPDSPYATTRGRVLGRLRAIRESLPLDAGQVAATIVRTAEDPAAPVRVVLADDGLRGLSGAVGGPDPSAHLHVRAAFGLDGPPGNV